LQVTTLGYGVMELRGAPRARDITEPQAETILNAKPSTSRAHYEAEAIRMVDDSHYGLAAYWTYDIGSRLRAAHAIESGGSR
jgi:hypothetical protein